MSESLCKTVQASAKVWHIVHTWLRPVWNVNQFSSLLFYLITLYWGYVCLWLNISDCRVCLFSCCFCPLVHQAVWFSSFQWWTWWLIWMHLESKCEHATNILSWCLYIRHILDTVSFFSDAKYFNCVHMYVVHYWSCASA